MPHTLTQKVTQSIDPKTNTRRRLPHRNCYSHERPILKTTPSTFLKKLSKKN